MRSLALQRYKSKTPLLQNGSYTAVALSQHCASVSGRCAHVWLNIKGKNPVLYHCGIYSHGNSANVAFFLSFSWRRHDKLALRAEMSDFQQSLGWRSLFKLPLCNFNSAAVSCMTCASATPGRCRISVSAQKSYSPPLGDDPSQTEGKTLAHTAAFRYVSMEQFPWLRFKALPVKEERQLCRLIDPSDPSG